MNISLLWMFEFHLQLAQFVEIVDGLLCAHLEFCYLATNIMVDLHASR